MLSLHYNLRKLILSEQINPLRTRFQLLFPCLKELVKVIFEGCLYNPTDLRSQGPESPSQSVLMSFSSFRYCWLLGIKHQLPVPLY